MVHYRFELGIPRRLGGSKWPVFRSERAVNSVFVVSEGGLELPRRLRSVVFAWSLYSHSLYVLGDHRSRSVGESFA